MIIDLRKSKLFTDDPAKRFSKTNAVKPKLFEDLMYRYSLQGYTVPDLCIYFHIKVGVPISQRKMHEWIFRHKIYLRAQDALKIGSYIVNTNFFGDLEDRLSRKLTEHMRYRETRNIKTLI